MARMVRAHLSLGTLALLVGCGGHASSGPPERIVLVVVDTLRADAVPWYGAPEASAPFLAELARDATVFDAAHSTSSWTAPATASLLTSLWPFQHGVLNGLVTARALTSSGVPVLTSRLPRTAPTLAETLSEAGWRTFGVSANPNVGTEAGFDRGFDRFACIEGSARAVHAAAEAWRDEFLAAERAFLYLHYMDPHAPYHLRGTVLDAATTSALERYLEGAPVNRPAYADDPRGLRVRHVLNAQRDGSLALDRARTAAVLRAAYDSEVRFFDARFRELFERFELDGAWLVVTADHGEEFGDHGGFGHEFSLYEELTRVPLFVRGPDGTAAGPPGASGARVARPVSLVDVVPTVRRFASAPALAPEAGHDLFARPIGEALFAGRTEPTTDGATRTLNAVWREPWKWIGRPRGGPELFDLAADPRERTNLARERPAEAEALAGELARAFAEAPRHERELVETELDADRRAELESLGYLGEE